MKIKTSQLNPTKPMLQQLRDMHPVKIGDVINGKRVTSTFYEAENGASVPCFKLDFGCESFRYKH